MMHLSSEQSVELRKLTHAMYTMCVELEALQTVADVSDLLYSKRARSEYAFTGGVAQWVALVNTCAQISLGV